MKKLPAIFAALVVTGVMALAMLVIGANAIFKPGSAAAANDPAAVEQIAITGGDAQTVAQLQARIQEYQAREQQYQQQLQQARAEIEQANSQIEAANSQLIQYEQMIANLQQIGVVRIDDDGNLSVGRFGRGDH